MIEVKELARSFGDVRALESISFVAEDGEITGLLGPNGAGKTTALRILYTALKPDSGSAKVDGIDVTDDPLSVQQRIGALPHSHGLYPRLTPREHIRYFGRLHGNVSEEEIETLLERLDMKDLADRKTSGFSQGQTVKVAIARALVHRPQNIILDEPTVGLDVMSTRAMRDFIRELRDEQKCVLFSSHIMQEVSALCDRIVVIAHGRVVASGTPDDLLSATETTNLEDAFVKAIGSAEGLA